jgi:MFS family permease
MPLGTTYSIAQILLMFPALVVAMLKGPEAPDVYAVLGAVFATVIVTLDAKTKTRRETISLIMGCGGFGSIAPGLIIHWVIPHTYELLTWHSWAFLGLVFGGFGYSLVKLIWFVAGKRAGEIVEERINHYTGKIQPVKVKKEEEDQ